MELLVDHSSVAEQLSRSKHPSEHLHVMLKQMEPSTIHRYLNGLEKFATWLQFDHTISWSTLQPYQLADFLVDITKKTSDWCYKPILLALTWTAKTFGLKSLLTSTQSPMIQAFFNSKAKPPLNVGLIPITLGMAYAIEKTLLATKSDVSILPLGTFLLMFWAGLRFSDIQRVKLSSLTISSGLLRGRTWKAKNAKQDFAFSCITSGLLGTHSSNWAFQRIGGKNSNNNMATHRPRFSPSGGESQDWGLEAHPHAAFSSFHLAEVGSSIFQLQNLNQLFTRSRQV